MWKQKAGDSLVQNILCIHFSLPAIAQDIRATCRLKAVHCGCIRIPWRPSSLSAALLEYIWAALYKSSPQPNPWMRITSGCSVNLPHTHTAFMATLGLLCGILTLPFCRAPQCFPYRKVIFSLLSSLLVKAGQHCTLICRKHRLKLRAPTPTAAQPCHPKHTQHPTRSQAVTQRAETALMLLPRKLELLPFSRCNIT